MKNNNKKGFTLAELLIVVAVIAVLVAVAIPTFSNQLEKSRQAVDISNLRGALAAATIVEMDGGYTTDGSVYTPINTEGTGDPTILAYNADTGNFNPIASATDAQKTEFKATTSKVVADITNLSTRAVYGTTHTYSSTTGLVTRADGGALVATKTGYYVAAKFSNTGKLMYIGYYNGSSWDGVTEAT